MERRHPNTVNTPLRGAEYAIVTSIVLFVAGLLLVAAYSETSGRNVLARIGAIDGHVLIGLVCLSLINYTLRAYRWQLFSNRLGLRLSAGRATLYYFSGFSMTTTPAKAGEALRLWFMGRCHGFQYSRLAPLFVADRLSDANAMVVLCLVGLLSFADYGWATLIASLSLIALTLGIARPNVLTSFVTRVHYLCGRRWSGFFDKTTEAMRLTAHLFTPTFLTMTLGLAIFGWLAEGLAFFWLLNELGAPVSLHQAIFIFAFSMVVGAVTLAPGGLGGVEAVMIGLLLSLGTNMETSIAATTVIRATTLWLAVAIGLALLPVALRLARRRIEPLTHGTTINE